MIEIIYMYVVIFFYAPTWVWIPMVGLWIWQAAMNKNRTGSIWRVR